MHGTREASWWVSKPLSGYTVGTCRHRGCNCKVLKLQLRYGVLFIDYTHACTVCSFYHLCICYSALGSWLLRFIQLVRERVRADIKTYFRLLPRHGVVLQ